MKTDIFAFEKTTVKVALIPERLRGETLPVDIKVKSKFMLKLVKELLQDILKN